MTVLLSISMHSIKPTSQLQMGPTQHYLIYQMYYHYSSTQFIEAISIQVRMSILNHSHKLKSVEFQSVKRNSTYFDVVYVSKTSNINILYPPLLISVLSTDCFSYD